MGGTDSVLGDGGGGHVVGHADGDSDAVAEGAYYGMQTFDQHLLELYRNGDVNLRDAMNLATNPHDFKVSLRAAGLANAS